MARAAALPGSAGYRPFILVRSVCAIIAVGYDALLRQDPAGATILLRAD